MTEQCKIIVISYNTKSSENNKILNYIFNNCC